MSNQTTKRFISIVAPLFFAAMLLGGCGGADESGYDDELVDDSVETDQPVGEAEEALRINPTGGGGGDDFCGWFCPVWAKDLSDCLMIPCKD